MRFQLTSVDVTDDAPKAMVNISGSGLLQLSGATSELIADDLSVAGNGIVKVDVRLYVKRSRRSATR